MSCDAYHATAPHPQGAGATAAMQSALRRAGLEPAAIDYVNAHGTGTRDNDVAEAIALKTVFHNRVPPFSSTKRIFGHALAASGAMEAVVCVEALRRQELPPNPGFSKCDPAIGLEPVTKSRPRAVDACDEQFLRLRRQQRRFDFFQAGSGGITCGRPEKFKSPSAASA